MNCVDYKNSWCLLKFCSQGQCLPLLPVLVGRNIKFISSLHPVEFSGFILTLNGYIC